jgi:TPR repeat protein
LSSVRSHPGPGPRDRGRCPCALALCLAIALLPASRDRLAATPTDDPELTRAIEAERSRCGAVAPRSCASLSLYYSRTAARLEKSPEHAATLDRLACGDGYLWGCFALAELTREGRGVPRDAVAAARLHEVACASGESRSCLRLGQMAETGEGIPRDPGRARSLYESECAAGRSAACWRLGLLLTELALESGEPGAISASEAFRRACGGGIGESCFRLALLLESEGAPEATVTRYFGQACDRDHPPGCLRFADALLARGDDASDRAFARRLLERACRQGLDEACTRL